jgi:hypothetical protein
MRKKVTYEAADRKSGFSADELRDALRRALVVGRVRATMGGKLYSVEVEEADQ